MPTSSHRLTLAETRGPMEPTYPLADLQRRYLDHHRALGRSPDTVLRYEATFRLFDHYLADTNRCPDSRALCAEVIQRFAVWLRETPVRPQRGSTKRSESSVHGALGDLRAFTRWLVDEEILPHPVKIRLPKLPQRLFPVLSEADLQRIWASRYLTGRSSLAVRNRAILGLMLDTGRNGVRLRPIANGDVQHDLEVVRSGSGFQV